MIFDSERMQSLRKRYASIHPCEWPRILWVDQAYPAWKTHLESLIQTVPPAVQKDWLQRLVHADDDQHMGAWFEMMLYGWLQQVGQVIVQPHQETSQPDFLVKTREGDVFVEAFVLRPPRKWQQSRGWKCRLWEVLEEIPRPFLIRIRRARCSHAFHQWDELRSQVINWLDENPEEPFVWETADCILRLEALPWPTSPGTASVMDVSEEAIWVDVTPLEKRLRRKYKQHRAVRAQGPFVLAVFFDRWDLAAGDVVTAWLGSERWIIDPHTLEVVRQDIDFSGLHYRGKGKPQYTHVSGTLAFHYGDIQQQPPFLVGRYVQNPFAKHPVDPNLWPVQARFVVVGETGASFKMKWVHSKGEGDVQGV